MILAALEPVLAQTNAAFSTDVNIARVPCVAIDEHGRRVTGLTQEDFAITVNGAPQAVVGLWNESNLPRITGIITDASASQRNQIAEHDRAIDIFLSHLVGLRDRGFVVKVDQNVTLTSEVRGGPYGLSHKLLGPRGDPLGPPCPALSAYHGRNLTICGGTALWNAVFYAAQLKLKPFAGTRVLVLLSDGHDTGSNHKLEAALQEAHRSETTIYAIRYPDGLQESKTDGIARLASETGGQLFEAETGGYTRLLDEIEADIKARYIVAFRADFDTTHPAAIQIASRKAGMTIRAPHTWISGRDSDDSDRK